VSGDWMNNIVSTSLVAYEELCIFQISRGGDKILLLPKKKREKSSVKIWLDSVSM
jgi:hypothetical protein